MAIAILTFLTALLPAILEVVKTIAKKQAREASTNEALARRSLSELSVGVDGVRGKDSVQP